MKKKEIKNIKKVIKNYKSIRNDFIEKRNEIESQFRNGDIMIWQRDFLIYIIYNEFENSKKRKKFISFAKKATKNDEFEKYFRAAHLLVFYNIKINPKNL